MTRRSPLQVKSNRSIVSSELNWGCQQINRTQKQNKEHQDKKQTNHHVMKRGWLGQDTICSLEGAYSMTTPSTVRKPKRRRFWQISRIYGFVRARQLEGTLTVGPRRGVYLINAARVFAGWGQISETRWPYPKRGASWPPPEPPGLDKIARFNKIYAYSRIRNLEDAPRCIAYEGPFLVSISINSGWAKAPNGAISMPEPEQPFTENHCVCVVGYDDNTRLLHFLNSWGPGWGDKGFGLLPYDYFTRFSQDAWYFQRPFLGCRIKKRTQKKSSVSIRCEQTLWGILAYSTISGTRQTTPAWDGASPRRGTLIWMWRNSLFALNIEEHSSAGCSCLACYRIPTVVTCHFGFGFLMLIAIRHLAAYFL